MTSQPIPALVPTREEADAAVSTLLRLASPEQAEIVNTLHASHGATGALVRLLTAAEEVLT